MTKWIVRGLIPEGHIVLVAGQPGNCKSWWMAQLATDAAQGEKHMGAYDVQKCNVIYIDEDTPTDVYEDRLSRMALGTPLNQLAIDRRSMTGFYLFQDKQRNNLVTDIKRLGTQGKPVLVIIDCLIKVMAGKNLDTTDGASKVMDYLRELRDAGATVVIVHHMSLKRPVNISAIDAMGQVLNSTVLVSSSDTAFVIQKASVSDRTIFLIKPQSRRTSLEVDELFAVELIEDDEKSVAVLLALDEVPFVPSDDAKQLFQLFPDKSMELTVKEIDVRLQEDLPKTRIRAGLAELVQQKCLCKTIDPHDRTHAAWYKRHPDFEALNSFYKQKLIVINI
jgi:archaellum biogenesis ATPase FlaH